MESTATTQSTAAPRETPTEEVDLSLRGVTKRFGDFEAVRSVSFDVPRGRFYSILGPSGCGKTTLLRMIAGFAEPSAGEIVLRGRSMQGVPPNKRPVSLVFQSLALFPMMSVTQNIAFGLERRGERKGEIARKVAAMLETVGLPGYGEHRIEQLSGGQKQRVAIARCLVLEPALLLLDEPLGALDLKLREQMKLELKKLQQQVGTTFLYITHDQSEALVMSDRIAVMNQGRIEQLDTPFDCYYNPATAFVAGFIGESNRWRGTASGLQDGHLQVRTEAGATLLCRANPAVQAGQAVQVFLRAEALSLTAAQNSPNALDVLVGSTLFDGNAVRLLVRGEQLPDEIAVALPQTPEHHHIRKGDRLRLHWEPSQSLCFPVAP
jgi:spermidine/putrescine transport system ATP-binding protein